MFKPFNPETFKVYDLCRSTATTPYELDYGYSDLLCDHTYYSSFNPSEPIFCRLSPTELEITSPKVNLSDNDIAEMISFTNQHIQLISTLYKEGYEAGFNDTKKYHMRKSFRNIEEYSLSFLLGYELGVYIAMTNHSMPPLEKLCTFTPPSFSKIYRSYKNKKK